MSSQGLKIADPTHDDRVRAVLTMIFDARDLVSETERQDRDARDPLLHDARHLLEASTRIMAHLPHRATLDMACAFVQRALVAVRAASYQLALARQYENSALEWKRPWDVEFAPKTRTVATKATVVARQEIHRALAEVCIAFPHIVPPDPEAN